MHILISTWHLAFTCIFVREFLTPLNLHVQVLKRGLKRSPPPKIKPISRSKLISPSSFCSWFFQQARGFPSQPWAPFCCTNCNFTFVSGCDIMYMYQYITLCDNFVIHMLECILPRASVLFSCLYWCLAYIREVISDLRMYVAVTSPYLPDRGVTNSAGCLILPL